MGSNLRKPWDYPDCPNCDSPVFVRGMRGRTGGRYRCESCDAIFREDD